jgi:hypothetical protein
MVHEHHVKGYESFVKFMETLKPDGAQINVLFSGEKLENGLSWCDDCVK